MKRLLAVLFATLALTTGAVAHAQTITYASFTQMFAGTNGFRGLFPGSPEYQWHHTDSTHSDVVWGTANWPGAPTGTNTLEHFSSNGTWIELSGWDTTTDDVTGISPKYTQHATLETSGNNVIDTSDGEEKYSYVTLSAGESYSLQTTGYITVDTNPSFHLPFMHTMSWTVSADGSTLTLWEDWDQGSPLVESSSYPRVAVLTAGQGWTYLRESNGWSNSESAYSTW